MSEDLRKLVERIHRQAAEELHGQPPPPPVQRPTIHYIQLPEKTPDNPLSRQEMCALVERVHRQAAEELRGQPPPLPIQRPTIHYTELPEDTPDSPLYQEWNTYRREVGRLLAEGHE